MGRRALTVEAIRALAPVAVELTRQIGNVATSTAQASATNPLPGFVVAMVASKLPFFNFRESLGIQIAAGGYLGTKLAQEGGGLLAGLAEAVPFSGDAPTVSSATSIQFDLADSPPGIAAGPNTFMEAFLKQQAKS